VSGCGRQQRRDGWLDRADRRGLGRPRPADPWRCPGL